MELILLARYWRHGLVLLLAAVCFISMAGWHDSRQDLKIMAAEHESEITALNLKHVHSYRAIEQKGINNIIEAINEAKKREQLIISDAASARAAVNSLSDTIESITTAAANDAKYSAAALDTTGKLLKECSGQYSSMAETADRISNDLRASQHASRR